jgi:hypothetical protein
MTDRKIFKHNLVEYVDFEDKIIDGKRYYYAPDGNVYKSVTTILGERTDSKIKLQEWRNKVGEEEATKKSLVASRRGTEVHKICEDYIKNDINFLKKSLPIHIDTFQQIQPILNSNVDNILGIEIPLYSKLFNTAGRSDLIAHFNGIPSIVDFKTSLRNKQESWIQSYFIQCTIYSLMFQELYSIIIPQLVVIIAVDDEQPQVFIKKTKDYYGKVKEIFIDYSE